MVVAKVKFLSILLQNRGSISMKIKVKFISNIFQVCMSNFHEHVASKYSCMLCQQMRYVDKKFSENFFRNCKIAVLRESFYRNEWILYPPIFASWSSFLSFYYIRNWYKSQETKLNIRIKLKDNTFNLQLIR